ncbi:MAG: pyrimidine-nucleoside phosphorylase [Alkalibacterium gilvum]|uniref:Pyrimidine-nucleoside phosphorylase n=1 Tax=Alkalibacterium gilvum TaxID=1130080 RepID=A0A1H6UNR3_9LACT|nr:MULTISPECIES: pyrimidine-nucleoside phosphorylase [Alkalibacterium]MDN6194847.1 pyrimidine-nucleoside phosphorylase [Alkalibacterium sp.]MDN6292990.1 pyrimidine-nucleoside phosphorylase [Alkalibacterium sp.]MDN6295218.1 pyrimidine-nucleoside phosphorylase [Alkalibacterium sp.]MDN6398465.1 pyrimidine-nucleoside phosphorylase [Alkalibacterium sp.]MDN6729652.1 pyrimidine-nucleoside phosphorylase [Alkalibacterium sp.]
MRMIDLIEKKQHNESLTESEIKWMIEHYTSDDIPDYQMSAMAMAIYFKGMNNEERSALTMAMVESGDQIDLSPIEGVKVDKHSTGGVGDTTTLVLAPLVASVGIPVAKMSGRGLGHTGGTIDKLEAVPGFDVEVTQEKFVELVNKNKVAVVGQSGNLTPADKKMYALRDVTGTVESIPLIASSIMSKKIAAGADAIVLDVKTGAGAFMKNVDQAKELAETMVNIGEAVGRNTMAVISDMSQPLGNAIGNGLEVKEAIDTLKGHGPKDLTELCLVLGSQMAYLGGVGSSLDEARAKLEENLHNGKALDVFRTFIDAQGGDASVADNPDSVLPKAKYTQEVKAEESGKVSEIVADQIGISAMMLGAGRETKESELDLAAGLYIHKKIGDVVEKGETIVTLYSNKEIKEEVSEKIIKNIKISDEATEPTLIHEIIQ